MPHKSRDRRFGEARPKRVPLGQAAGWCWFWIALLLAAYIRLTSTSPAPPPAPQQVVPQNDAWDQATAFVGRQ
jgi:hypothetical protein